VGDRVDILPAKHVREYLCHLSNFIYIYIYSDDATQDQTHNHTPDEHPQGSGRIPEKVQIEKRKMEASKASDALVNMAQLKKPHFNTESRVLVLDLDGTLVHSSENNDDERYIQLSTGGYFCLRPHVEDFLSAV
jgi:hypothetical protein